MINPWRIARAHPSLTIEFVDLPPGELGKTDVATDTIYLTNGMRQRQRRAVLMHELHHWFRGGVEDCDHLEDREERYVERLASIDLMPFDALVEALVWCVDEYELADHFHVDVATVRDRLAYLDDADTARINSELDRREARLP